MIDWFNWSKQIPGCQGVQHLLTEYMLRCHGCTCYMHVRGHDLNPRLATKYKQSANLHDNLTISECIRFATCLKRIPEPLGTVQQPFFFRVSLNLNWFLGLYTSSHSNGVGQFVWSKALPFPVTQDGPLNQRKTSCVKSIGQLQLFTVSSHKGSIFESWDLRFLDFSFVLWISRSISIQTSCDFFPYFFSTGKSSSRCFLMLYMSSFPPIFSIQLVADDGMFLPPGFHDDPRAAGEVCDAHCDIWSGKSDQ